jgi:hypothetical protein
VRCGGWTIVIIITIPVIASGYKYWFSQVYSAARSLEGLQSENKGQGWKQERHAYGQIFCDTLPGQGRNGK